MSLVSYAESELDRIGMTDDGDMNGIMRKHLLHMIKEFADEGHSGFSGNYALQCLKKLLNFKPLSALTGEDDEWTEVSNISGYPHFQNKRCSSVFKDGKTGEAYDIDGKVFWEWYKDDDGNVYKSHYTNFESRVPVKFPYIVPDEPIYEWRVSSHDPQQSTQTEEGFV
jgi:hypothetical protein